ncbi:hypothetical protein D3C78_1197420 [compost metagenome]
MRVVLPALLAEQAGDQHADEDVPGELASTRFEGRAVLVQCGQQPLQPRQVFGTVAEVGQSGGVAGGGMQLPLRALEVGGYGHRESLCR